MASAGSSPVGRKSIRASKNKQNDYLKVAFPKEKEELVQSLTDKLYEEVLK